MQRYHLFSVNQCISNSNSVSYDSLNTKKDTSEEMSCLVDQTPEISNLLEDIKKVERFAQYIENQASENMEEMEGSEK